MQMNINRSSLEVRQRTHLTFEASAVTKQLPAKLRHGFLTPSKLILAPGISGRSYSLTAIDGKSGQCTRTRASRNRSRTLSSPELAAYLVCHPLL